MITLVLHFLANSLAKHGPFKTDKFNLGELFKRVCEIVKIFLFSFSYLRPFVSNKIGDFTLTGSTTDEGFIPFENLTEETVLGWVSSNVDKTLIETQNSSSISELEIREETKTEIYGTPW